MAPNNDEIAAENVENLQAAPEALHSVADELSDTNAKQAW